MVGAGAVVTRDVPPKAIVVGNPARIAGYVDAVGTRESVRRRRRPRPTASLANSVPGVDAASAAHRVRPAGIPVRRRVRRRRAVRGQAVFLVYDVPSKDVRGEHAHKRASSSWYACAAAWPWSSTTAQPRGDLAGLAGVGLYIPPMVWGVQYKYSADAVLMVLASEHYDASDYLRDYDEFSALCDGERVR